MTTATAESTTQQLVNNLPEPQDLKDDPDCLPCEKIFFAEEERAPDERTRDQLRYYANKLGVRPKYIPNSSLRKTVAKELTIQGHKRIVNVPLFTAIDPAIDTSPARVAAAANQALRVLSGGICGWHDKEFMDFMSLGGMTIGLGSHRARSLKTDDIDTDDSVERTAVSSQLYGWKQTRSKQLSVKTKLMKGFFGSKTVPDGEQLVEVNLSDDAQRTTHWAAYFAALPGRIPPEAVEKIKFFTRKVAGDSSYIKVMLICEADWKQVAGLTHVEPKSKDPLIVMKCFDHYLYLDRFDCTAAEEHLAREHAVSV